MSLVTDKLQLPFAYYRIYSINRPGRLLNFLNLDSGRLFEAGRLLLIRLLLIFTIFSK